MKKYLFNFKIAKNRQANLIQTYKFLVKKNKNNSKSSIIMKYWCKIVKMN